MKLDFSRISKNIVQSEIRTMSIECDKINGINLSQGVCDLKLPQVVAESSKKAIENGFNQYSRYDGQQELREAISRKLLKHNKITADPNKNITVSCGATGAFYCACLSLLNPGDEVIVFEPFYGYHVNTLLAVGVYPVYAKLLPPDWSIDLSLLEKLVSSQTKGIIINTPANPSGKVFSYTELKNLAKFANKHDLVVFTDEIYEYFVYDNAKHISPGSLDEIKTRTVTISGYSKTFSITGWRIGYCVSNEHWAQMIGYISDLIYVCAPTPLQIGVAKGIDDLNDDFYSNHCVQYKQKRDKMCEVLYKVGMNPIVPQGSYYILADSTHLPGNSSKEKAMYLLNNYKIATVPGDAFFHSSGGENLLRFCYAKENRVIDSACKQLLTMK